MAELTPSTMDVLFRPNDGLRKLADQVARNVTTWYRDLWWKSSSTVAVDFFHSTDIVDVAVDASLKRIRCANHPSPEVNVLSTTDATSTTTTAQQHPTLIDDRMDRRRFYQGPRSLDVTTTIDSTTEASTESVETTSKVTRQIARRRRPKNTTSILPPNPSVMTPLIL